MSGLEVAASIAAIVSGFASGYGMFRDWREKRRRAKKTKSRSEETEEKLRDTGHLIRQEYDRDFARLGRRFAVGDDIGRSELQSQQIILQQGIINLLGRALSGNLTIGDLQTVLLNSNAVHMGSIRALDAQFQCMSVAAPIRSLAPTVAQASPEVNNRPEKPSCQPPSLPEGWIAQWHDMSHEYYFVQLSNGVSQWETPTHAALGPEAIPQSIEYPYDTPSVEEGQVDTNQDNHCSRSESYKQGRPAYCKGSYWRGGPSLLARNWVSWVREPHLSGCVKCDWQLSERTAMKVVLSKPNDTIDDESRPHSYRSRD